MEIKLETFGKVSVTFNHHDLKSVVEQLFDDYNTLQLYIVIKPTEPIGNIVYMQAAKFNGKKYKGARCIEVRRKIGRKFKHYRVVTDSAEIMFKIFTDFYMKKIVPNFDDWEDVTFEFSKINKTYHKITGFNSFLIQHILGLNLISIRNIWFTKAQTEYIKNHLSLDFQPDKGIYVTSEQQQTILAYCKHSQLNPIESLNSEIEKWIIKDIEEGKEYNFEAENYLCPSCGKFSIDGIDEYDGICLSCYIKSKHGVFDAIIFKVVKKAIDAWNPYCLLPEAPRDEFDSESREIADLISEASTADFIAEKIASVFSLSFEVEFTKSDCMIPAEKIVDILQKATE